MKGHIGGLLVLISAIAVTLQGRLEGYIVGGEYTDIQRVPHSVFLLINYGPDEWICGSSVLTQTVLLTAAHCLYDCEANGHCSIIAYAGHESLEEVKVLRSIEKYAIHEHYNNQKVVNDVAVAKIRSPLKLGPSIKRVILLEKPRILVGDTGTVAGWGVIDEEVKEDTTRLKVARATVRGPTWCRYIGVLSRGMFCAGYFEGDHARPAEGDSGSAFIMDNYQQIGLVSFKVTQYPALVVYTNVSHYFHWIQDNAGQLSCST